MVLNTIVPTNKVQKVSFTLNKKKNRAEDLIGIKSSTRVFIGLFVLTDIVLSSFSLINGKGKGFRCFVFISFD